MLSEDNLRKVIGKCFGKDVTWIEPAWGSSVGIPDAEFPVGDTQVKVELKFWKKNRKGLRCIMRPSQIRHHIMSYKKEIKTAIMWGMEVPGSNNEYSMWLLSGRYCPMHPYVNKVAENSILVGYSLQTVDNIKGRIITILEDDTFWL